MTIPEWREHCKQEGCPNAGEAVINMIKFIKKNNLEFLYKK